MVLYDSIGENYDESRHADPFISSRLYFYLKPDLDLRYLDMACGTGNYTISLRQLGLHVGGLDQSIRMINKAQLKDSSVEWILGDTEELPFSDKSYSGVTCILAIHHFSNLQRVFNEVARVLSSKGHFVIFTATSDQMRKYWLNEYFPEAMRRSTMQMPSKKEIKNSLESAGFRKIKWDLYEIKEDLKDLFLYSGKNHPELYLNPRIRSNISTFAALAESNEVTDGCSRLNSDIHTGRIHHIIESYVRQSEGDYVFVIGQR